MMLNTGQIMALSLVSDRIGTYSSNSG